MTNRRLALFALLMPSALVACPQKPAVEYISYLPDRPVYQNKECAGQAATRFPLSHHAQLRPAGEGRLLLAAEGETWCTPAKGWARPDRFVAHAGWIVDEPTYLFRNATDKGAGAAQRYVIGTLIETIDAKTLPDLPPGYVAVWEEGRVRGFVDENKVNPGRPDPNRTMDKAHQAFVKREFKDALRLARTTLSVDRTHEPARRMAAALMIDQHDLEGWHLRQGLKDKPLPGIPVAAAAVVDKVAYVAASELSLRNKPSSRGARIALVPAGIQVQVTEQKGTWSKVKLKGSTGVHTLVRAVRPDALAPTVDPWKKMTVTARGGMVASVDGAVGWMATAYLDGAPPDREGLVKQGRVHQGKGEHEKALVHFQRALALLPAAETANLVFDSAAAAGRYHQALLGLKKAVSTDADTGAVRVRVERVFGCTEEGPTADMVMAELGFEQLGPGEIEQEVLDEDEAAEANADDVLAAEKRAAARRRQTEADLAEQLADQPGARCTSDVPFQLEECEPQLDTYALEIDIPVTVQTAGEGDVEKMRAAIHEEHDRESAAYQERLGLFEARREAVRGHFTSGPFLRVVLENLGDKPASAQELLLFTIANGNDEPLEDAFLATVGQRFGVAPPTIPPHSVLEIWFEGADYDVGWGAFWSRDAEESHNFAEWFDQVDRRSFRGAGAPEALEGMRPIESARYDVDRADELICIYGC